ncbi:putative sulfate exporter family transporter [Pontibacillus yanchengensis]|uniref:Sulfate exporter family transporter n=1 Tax=Pontibacillus yanchengensis TaxID=462910 RepID=A0ACC7VI96_9BACI|nr:putative sulfate exporter family transporter [Pontibacillus yanchengensis]MYL54497.1 putative sulfate exporter family transporter [Pontibacillus yanchengensis]
MIRLNTKLQAGGILLTFLFASAGLLLAQLPGFQHIGPLASSILLAVAYRHFLGYPTKLKHGIDFSTKILLRLAIILFGLKLNLDVVFQEGLGLLARGAITIIFSILITLLLAKWLKANWTISFLLAVGTGVCGAAAIAAISPIIKSKDEDTALSVGIIALVGTLFGIGYTLVGPYLPITAEQYGMWTGLSLHEIAHVALAAAPAGEDALALAFLAKLGRVLLLIPLSFLLVLWMRRKKNEDTKTTIAFPWFLLGFMAMSFIGSYMIGEQVPVPSGALETISFITTMLLSMAMSGLGLNVDIRKVRTVTLKPLLAMLLTSILLSLLTFFLL